MQSTSSRATEPSALPREDAPAGVGSRLFALGALVITAGSLLWLVVAIGRLLTDSWIAPIALSPDSDAVLTMNLELTRQRAEIERAQAEVERIDAAIEAVDGGLERMESLRDRTAGVLAYTEETTSDEEAAATRMIRDLHEELAILDRLIARQRTETERARDHLAAGLIERRELETEEQSLDHLELQRIQNLRATEEAEMHRRQAHAAVGELHATAAGDEARMPELVARQEGDVQLEIEILELQAERRGLVALHDVAVRSVASLQAVMDQIEQRPIYLATREPMNVAFVPYAQLEGVSDGQRILQCTAGIFFCHDVGRVARVLPGEVVTQDPWGELARGRYAVLDLEDDDAVQERILRVR